MDDPPITFLEKDVKGVQQPHDDALVLTLVITNYKTHRVLIDSGSSANILYLMAFEQMGLGKDKLRPMKSPLVSLTGDRLFPLGLLHSQSPLESDLSKLPKWLTSWWWISLHHTFPSWVNLPSIK